MNGIIRRVWAGEPGAVFNSARVVFLLLPPGSQDHDILGGGGREMEGGLCFDLDFPRERVHQVIAF